MDVLPARAAMQYAATRPATAPQGAAQSPDAAGLAGRFAAYVQAGEDTARAAMVNEAGPQALVQALAQTELAVETAVTIRDRVVEAYQEILRMPV